MPSKRNTSKAPAGSGRALPLSVATLHAPEFGDFRIEFESSGIRRIDRAWEPLPANAHPDAVSRPLPTPWRDVLVAYFAGEPVDPTSIPVVLEGTPFRVKVWQALRRIPRGEVRTYASIAADIGTPRGMRAVGAANHANPIPIVVPCHRVIEAGSMLGGFGWGLPMKRKLLALEGVRVDGDTVLGAQLSLL